MALFSPSQVPSKENLMNSIFSTPSKGVREQPYPVKRKTSPAHQYATTSKQLSPVESYYEEPKTPTPRKHVGIRNKDQSFDQFYSPISVAASEATFRSAIPVEMLSFDYVSTCQSETDLYQIVSTLQTDNPNSYPALLKTAKRQLQSVQEKVEEEHSPLPPSPSPGRTNAVSAVKSVRWAPSPSSCSLAHSSSDESSLMMSLSTAMLDDHSSLAQPSPRFAQQPLFAGKLQEVHEERSHLEQQLSSQVQTLQRQLGEMEECQREEQLTLMSKIKALEQARERAEENVVMLQQAVEASSRKAHSLAASMDNIDEQREALRHALNEEKSKHRQQEEQAYAMEQELRQTVAQLSTQAQSSSKTVELQAKLQQELKKRSECETQFQQSLADARSQLQSIQTEQTKMLTSLQQALGRDPSLVATFRVQDRQALVRDISRKLASSRAAVKAFAQAMAGSEQDRHKLKEAHRLAVTQVAELKSLSEKVKRENALLTQQNETMTEELEKKTAFVDSLQLNHKDIASYKIREEEYKHTIALLRKQIRSGESVVSLSLYQKAVAEGKETLRRHKAKSDKVSALETNVTSLQNELKAAQVKKSEVLKWKEAKSPHAIKSPRSLGMGRIVRRPATFATKTLPPPAPVAKPPSACKAVDPPASNRSFVPSQSAPPAGPMPSAIKRGALLGAQYAGGQRVSFNHDGESHAIAPNTTVKQHVGPPAASFGRVRAHTVLKPNETATSTIASRAPPPPPPPTMPLSHVAVNPKPAAFRDNVPRPKPVSTPRRKPLSVKTKSSPPPPPPPQTGVKRVSPNSSKQRAFNRLNAVKAAGGRTGIREKLKQIRRSPLGNASNRIGF